MLFLLLQLPFFLLNLFLDLAWILDFLTLALQEIPIVIVI